jgi:tetratricopeptide (TPR) repeat protein/DNA-binding CsgD family transcriptional regulator
MSIDELRDELRYTDDPRERASLLTELASQLYNRSECQAAVEPAEQALKLAVQLRDRPLRAQILLLTGEIKRATGDYREAEKAERKGLELCRALGDRQNEAGVLLQLGMTLYRLAEYQEALDMLQQSRQILATLDDPYLTSKVLMVQGRIHGTLGDPQRSLALQMDALALLDPQRHAAAYPSLLINIGKTYFDAGEFDEAERYWQQANESARNADDRMMEGLALTNLARLHITREQPEPALALFQQGLSLARELNDHAQEILTLGGIGRVHAIRGEYNEAMRYLSDSRAAAAERNDKINELVETETLGMVVVRSGDVAGGMQLLHQALDQCRAIDARSYEWEIHKELAAAYEQSGDIANAYEHFKQFAAIREEVMGKEQQRAIDTLRMKHDIETAYREREIFRLENEQLQSDLLHKNNELTSMALHLVQKNEVLEKIRDEVVQLVEAATADAKPMLKRLVPMIQQSIGTEQEWQQFEQQFVEVHPEFVDTLLKRAPELTQTEVRIAALLRIQLTTKDIASIMNVTTRAVEKHRLNIRRKLGLEGEVNLPAYLATM